jgi:hypothetical protein
VVGAACSNSSPTTPSTTDSPYLLLTAPKALSLAPGDSQQIRLLAALTDRTTTILTTTATWTSSNPSVASVNEAGVLSAVSAGTATITATAATKSATIAVTVAGSSTLSPTYIGTAAGQENLSATLTLSIIGTERATGVLYVGSAVALVGRYDPATQVVNVEGGGYTLLGRIDNGILAGQLTDRSGNVGQFSLLDATHDAVTTFCGTYTSDGVTAADAPDTGVWNLQVSSNGTVTGEAAVFDGSAAPQHFVGTRSGSAFTTSDQNVSANGSIDKDAATAAFRSAAQNDASASATNGACH